jgi:hypothetical protein
VLPQPLTTVKSPLVIFAAISVNAVSPEFVNVTKLGELADPASCGAKLSEAGESVSVATEAPRPVSEVFCVPAESARVKTPFRVPAAVGEKTINTLQLTPGARSAAQVFAVIWKSPETAGVCSVADTPPVFETVMLCAGVVWPTISRPKSMLSGFRTTEAGAAPIPVRVAVDWPPAIFANTVSAPLFIPGAAAKKTTCAVQLPLTATGAPVQLSVSWNDPVVMMPATTSGAVPLLLMVMVLAELALPITWLGKLSACGSTAICALTGGAAVSKGISQIPRP